MARTTPGPSARFAWPGRSSRMQPATAQAVPAAQPQPSADRPMTQAARPVATGARPNTIAVASAAPTRDTEVK
jgi:hypothetical protein